MIIESTTLIYVENSDIPADGCFIIPGRITEIGDGAFEGCTQLTAVTFNERLTQIGNWAFRDCTHLTTVAFNKQLTIIGESAFANCTQLTHVAFNEQLTEIGEWAFANCTQLTAVTFNKQLKQIKGWAFTGCTKLAAITFNENLTQIGNWAFFRCTSLSAVHFNKELLGIGCKAFEDCRGLIAVTFNTQLTKIGDWAFLGCINIKNIAIATKNQEVHNQIKKLLPQALRWRCIEMFVYEQLLAIRTEALRGILAEPVTHPVRRYANNLSSFENFPQYADFWQVLNRVDPESNLFYNKAKRLMDCLPWPNKNDQQGFIAYRNQCQEIVDNCLKRAAFVFFASPANTTESADLNHQNDVEVLCKKIKMEL